MPARTTRKAKNSVVLNDALVSVLRRRSRLGSVRPSRSRPSAYHPRSRVRSRGGICLARPGPVPVPATRQHRRDPRPATADLCRTIGVADRVLARHPDHGRHPDHHNDASLAYGDVLDEDPVATLHARHLFLHHAANYPAARARSATGSLPDCAFFGTASFERLARRDTEGRGAASGSAGVPVRRQLRIAASVRAAFRWSGAERAEGGRRSCSFGVLRGHSSGLELGAGGVVP